MNTSKKFYIVTQGCQMNEYDSNMMHSLLTDKMGFEETSNSNKADLLIVNTCSIREKAQEKVFSLLGQWNKLKSQISHILSDFHKSRPLETGAQKEAFWEPKRIKNQSKIEVQI